MLFYDVGNTGTVKRARKKTGTHYFFECLLFFFLSRYLWHPVLSSPHFFVSDMFFAVPEFRWVGFFSFSVLAVWSWVGRTKEDLGNGNSIIGLVGAGRWYTHWAGLFDIRKGWKEKKKTRLSKIIVFLSVSRSLVVRTKKRLLIHTPYPGPPLDPSVFYAFTHFTQAHDAAVLFFTLAPRPPAPWRSNSAQKLTIRIATCLGERKIYNCPLVFESRFCLSSDSFLWGKWGVVGADAIINYGPGKGRKDCV